MRILVAIFFRRIWPRAYQCVVHSCIPVVSRVFFGFRCRSVPPIQAWTSPSSPLSLLSPSRFFLDFHSRQRKKSLRIFVFSFFFLSFRHSLGGYRSAWPFRSRFPFPLTIHHLPSPLFFNYNNEPDSSPSITGGFRTRCPFFALYHIDLCYDIPPETRKAINANKSACDTPFFFSFSSHFCPFVLII